MRFSWRRFTALVSKEAKDILKNPNVSIMFMFPILFGFIFANLVPDMPREVATTMAVYMGLVMGGIYVPAMMVAEEKEKNTIQVLMLSPATPLEFLLGKSAITFTLVSLVSVGAAFVAGTGMGNALVFIATIMLTLFFTIFLGLIIGLLSPNQMATGAIGLPVYLGLMMVPLLMGSENPTIRKIMGYIPTYHTGEALFKNLQGEAFSAVTKHLLTLGVWVLVAGVLFMVFYRKKGLQK